MFKKKAKYLHFVYIYFKACGIVLKLFLLVSSLMKVLSGIIFSLNIMWFVALVGTALWLFLSFSSKQV
jgi:hypothetical protein